MLKRLLFRLAGFILAVVAFVPAYVSVIKNAPAGFAIFFQALYRPVWLWRWVWAWMPSLRAPWHTRSDVVMSFPGLLALALIGVGLGMLFSKSKQSRDRQWEDES